MRYPRIPISATPVINMHVCGLHDGKGRMKQFKRIGVIGAGTMGNGIAQVCASAGLQVVLVDVSRDSVAHGVAALTAGLERLERKGFLAASQKVESLARVHGTTRYEDLKDVDVVIESATENPSLKLDILGQAERVVPADALIGSNTSSISITQLAAVLGRPERFIGLHFFNPVPTMALVELIPGLQTSDGTRARAAVFASTIGKTPIVVRNSPGFVVNRILIPMLNEAIFAIQEKLGSVDDIDTAMQIGGGHPIGPLRLADLVGLDVVLAIMEVLQSSFGDPKYRPAPLLREMVQAGHLGRKSGQGFFSY